MGAALLSGLLTEILIPLAAVIGIVFALVQWVLVSNVKLTPEANAPGSKKNGGFSDSLIEEEEGLNDHNVVTKCAEIQSAISEGATSFLFTEYRYVGVFMIAFAILIFLFLGSVEGFTQKASHVTIARINIANQHLQMPSLALYPSCLERSHLCCLVSLG